MAATTLPHPPEEASGWEELLAGSLEDAGTDGVSSEVVDGAGVLSGGTSVPLSEG